MRISILVFLAVFSQSIYAGTGGGEIQRIIAHSSGGNGSGVVMFTTELNANKAACSTTGGGKEWAFSLEKQHGRAMYTLLLSAEAQGKSITVAGSNDCSVWSDRERPSYIYIVN